MTGGLEQHQPLQFKYAIDVFLRVILGHSMSRPLSGRKLMQSEEMCRGDEHIAHPFLFTRARSDPEGACHWSGTLPVHDASETRSSPWKEPRSWGPPGWAPGVD